MADAKLNITTGIDLNGLHTGLKEISKDLSKFSKVIDNAMNTASKRIADSFPGDIGEKMGKTLISLNDDINKYLSSIGHLDDVDFNTANMINELDILDNKIKTVGESIKFLEQSISLKKSRGKEVDDDNYIALAELYAELKKYKDEYAKLQEKFIKDNTSISDEDIKRNEENAKSIEKITFLLENRRKASEKLAEVEKEYGELSSEWIKQAKVYQDADNAVKKYIQDKQKQESLNNITEEDIEANYNLAKSLDNIVVLSKKFEAEKKKLAEIEINSGVGSDEWLKQKTAVEKAEAALDKYVLSREKEKALASVNDEDIQRNKEIADAVDKKTELQNKYNDALKKQTDYDKLVESGVIEKDVAKYNSLVAATNRAKDALQKYTDEQAKAEALNAIDENDIRRNAEYADSIEKIDSLTEKYNIELRKLTEMEALGDTGSEKWYRQTEAVNKAKDALQKYIAKEQELQSYVSEQDIAENAELAKRINHLDVLNKKLDEEKTKLALIAQEHGQDSYAWVKQAEAVNKAEEAIEKYEEKQRQLLINQAKEFEESIRNKEIIKETADEYDVLNRKKQEQSQPTKNSVFNTILLDSLKKASGLFGALDKTLTRLTKRVISFGVAASKAFGKMMLAPLRAIIKPLTKISAMTTRLKSLLQRIIIYRGLRSTLMAVTNSIKEGIEELYRWGSVSDSVIGNRFVKNMDKLVTAIHYLKNTVTAFITPIVNYIAPKIDKFIDNLVIKLNNLNAGLSAAFGNDSFIKAVKVPKTYADSLKSASDKAKELKRDLMGFDKLNRLSGDKEDLLNDSYLGYFEEAAAKEGKLAEMSKVLKNAFSGTAKQAEEAGKAIAKWLNSGIDILYPKLGLLGERFGKFTTNVLHFVDAVLKNTNWEKLGASVANFINKFLKNFDSKKAGEVLMEFINTIFRLLDGFAEELDWAAIGESIANFIIGAIDRLEEVDWSGTISKIFSGISTAVKKFFDKMFTKDDSGQDAFQRFANNIATGINTIVDNILNDENTFENVKGVFKAITELIATIVRNVDWNQIITLAKELFLAAWSGVGEGDEDAQPIIKWIVGLFAGIKLAKYLPKIVGFIKGPAVAGVLKEIAIAAGTSLGAVVAALGAVIVAVIAVIKNWDALKEAGKLLRESITIFFSNLELEISRAWENIKTWWSTHISKFFKKEYWSKKFEKITSGISEGFESLKNNIHTAWENIKKWFSEHVGKFFTKEYWSDKFSSIKEGLKSALNGVIGFIEQAINGIVDKINAFKISLPDKWYIPEKLRGVEFGLTLKHVQLPRLATGTVVPANYGEFAAILGDNKREPEVVSPISTMKQAFKEAIAEAGGFRIDSSDVYIDGQRVGRIVFDIHNDTVKRTGKTPLRGV